MPEIIEISDSSAPQLEMYSQLSEPQLLHYFEPQAGIFIAESPAVISLALDAGYQPLSLLLERRHIENQARDIIKRCGDIPIFTASEEILTNITGFKLTRGALCAMRRKPLPTAAEICAGARRIAVLENVVNPTNVGAIIRSAAALDIQAVLLTPPCSDPLYRRAARVSMGTVFQIAWTYLEDGDYMAQLGALGFSTAAMALCGNSVSIADRRLKAEEKLAIILGTEGTGLCADTISRADYTVKIPMANGIDSLNVAAASAVAFWELTR